MNVDIRIWINFRGHRKRRKLKALLGPDATDYLLDLWIGTAVSRPAGILHGYSALDIALEAGWVGDPNELVSKLIEVGFLDVLDDGTYALHEWEEHQPFVVQWKARSERARKAIQARWQKSSQGKGPVEHLAGAPDTPAEGSGDGADLTRKQAAEVATTPAESSTNTPSIPPNYVPYTASIPTEYDSNTQGLPPEYSSNTRPIPGEKAENTPRIRNEYSENTPRTGREYSNDTLTVPPEFSENSDRNTPYRTLPYQISVSKNNSEYKNSASADAVRDLEVSEPRGADGEVPANPEPTGEAVSDPGSAPTPHERFDQQPDWGSPSTRSHQTMPLVPDSTSENADEGFFPDAASKTETCPPTTPDLSEASSYLSRRKRKLTGWKLQTFSQFWKAFNHKKGKAEAADAWLDISGLSAELAARIIETASREAAARPALIARGGAPKWAQGWLSGRRWEDWEENGDSQSKAGTSGREENHESEEARSDRENESEYFQSIRDAVKRFM